MRAKLRLRYSRIVFEREVYLPYAAEVSKIMALAKELVDEWNLKPSLKSPIILLRVKILPDLPARKQMGSGTYPIFKATGF